MNKFKKGGFQKRSGGFGGRSKFGSDRDKGRPGGRMELFPAVCAECKKNCEVPFRPTNDKPVYCRDCFGKQRQVPGRNSNGADGPRVNFQREEFQEREYRPEPTKPQNDEKIDALKRQLDLVESKLNRILELVNVKPETPAPITPNEKVIPRVSKIVKTKTPSRKVVAKKK